MYVFLERIAEQGYIPLIAASAKPLMRSDIAMLLENIDASLLSDAALTQDLRYFRRDFFRDIEYLGGESGDDDSIGVHTRVPSLPEWHASEISGDGFGFTFDPIIGVGFDFSRNKTILRRATGIQFRGHVEGKIGYYFRFVDHVERGNAPYLSRSDLLEDRYGYVGPLHGGKETYYDLTEAYLTAGWKVFDVGFGKESVAWGRSREGGLLLSGRAPSFTHLKLSAELGSRVRFVYLAGELHPWSAPADTAYATDTGWMRVLPARKWIAAHRLEYQPWDAVLFGVAEAVVWGDRGLDASYLNPLNFYYSAEHDGGDLDNVLLCGDITVRLKKAGILYASLLIDDLKTSTLGSGDPGNKIGFQAGGRSSSLAVSGLELGIEYTRLEPYVYSHFFPVNRFATWTSPLGSDLTPNSDRLRWRLSYRAGREVEFILKVDRVRHGSQGGSIDLTIVRNGDEKVSFLGGVREVWTAVETRVRWEVKPKLFFEAGRVWMDKSAWFEDRFIIGASYHYY